MINAIVNPRKSLQSNDFSAFIMPFFFTAIFYALL